MTRNRIVTIGVFGVAALAVVMITNPASWLDRAPVEPVQAEALKVAEPSLHPSDQVAIGRRVAPNEIVLMDVPCWRDERAYYRFRRQIANEWVLIGERRKAAESRNHDRLAELDEIDRSCLFVKQDTLAMVIALPLDAELVEVRLLDGKHAGERGFVERAFVQRLDGTQGN